MLGTIPCSISVAPRVFPSSALPWPRLVARSPPAATPAPRPLPTAVLSHGARQAWLAAPLRVSDEPQPLLPPRPLLGREVRGDVPQAPLKHGNAGGTSIAELDALPSAQCGVRCSLKPSRPVPRGLAVPTPRPMTMSTTRGTPCCSCSPTPSSHLLYLRTSASWMSSWWPSLAGSPWTFSPLLRRIGPILNPIIWLTNLDVISGSEARFRLGL